MKTLRISLVVLGVLLAGILLGGGLLLWHVRAALSEVKDRVSQAQKHVSMGNILYDQGKYALAIDEYTRALSLVPSLRTAQENISFARRMMDPEGWLEQHPDDYKFRLRLFAQLLNDGEWSRARDCATDLSDRAKSRQWIAIVDMMELSDRVDQGPRVIAGRIENSSRHASALTRVLALFYARKGRWPESDDEIRLYAGSVRDGECLSSVSILDFEQLQDGGLKVSYALSSSIPDLVETNIIVLSPYKANKVK